MVSDSQLAALGGRPEIEQPWPAWARATPGDVERVAEVVRSGHWAYEGPMEEEFSAKFAVKLGVAYGFCVTNGTTALELALRAAGVGPGDEVIVPALTWIGCASAVLAVGASAVFVDSSREDYQIAPSTVERAITPRTRAIIVVHLYCRIAPVEEVRTIAAGKGIVVIEDCAHAHGARLSGGRMAGSLGDIGCFSFQSSKVMTSGEGGYVATNDEKLAARLYEYKNCGRPWRGSSTGAVIGGNARITEFQAALLIGQLDRLEGNLMWRLSRMSLLDKVLGQLDCCEVLPAEGRVEVDPCYAYLTRCRLGVTAGVSLPTPVFRAALRAEGVPVVPTYGAVYHSELWVAQSKTDSWRGQACPVAEYANEETFVLESSVLLASDEMIERLGRAVRKIVSGQRALYGVQVEELRRLAIHQPLP